MASTVTTATLASVSRSQHGRPPRCAGRRPSPARRPGVGAGLRPAVARRSASSARASLGGARGGVGLARRRRPSSARSAPARRSGRRCRRSRPRNITAIRSREREHLVELGGDDQHRRAPVALLDDPPVHVLDRADVQAARRLGGDQQLDRPGQLAGDARPSAGCRPTASPTGVVDRSAPDVELARACARPFSLHRGEVARAVPRRTARRRAGRARGCRRSDMPSTRPSCWRSSGT